MCGKHHCNDKDNNLCFLILLILLLQCLGESNSVPFGVLNELMSNAFDGNSSSNSIVDNRGGGGCRGRCGCGF
ncbi:MAG: hypothetical protein ACOYIR_04215 [Christensenellales bacterium]